MRRLVSALAGITLLVVCRPAPADGPADNQFEKVRPIPPAGITVPEDVKSNLTKGAEALTMALQQFRSSRSPHTDHWADVEIFRKAVDWALRYNEFFRPTEFSVAELLLAKGNERLAALRQGRAPWDTETGLVVRGYVSRIDGSVQPYGLVIPSTYRFDAKQKHRLDLWFHGRGEQLSELNFINDRMRNPGEFTPPDTIVLHLYGRYCNANKFAGEIDAFEALDDVRKHYRIDEDRIVVRGFSMGGAACWQFAVHYPLHWAAAAPGAGFSETPDFLKVFQRETLQPTWYEKKLWHLYDCTDYALNLFNLPTVAYSGEIDSQKQAADIMEAALAKEGLKLTHIIGPKTGHSYHPEAKADINRRIDAFAAAGRNRVPEKIRFVTYTTRYHQAGWISVLSLEEHWERAQVDAEITDRTSLRISTRNITSLRIVFEPGTCPLSAAEPTQVTIDGQAVSIGTPNEDRSLRVQITKRDGRWQLGAHTVRMVKRPGLQGPIDDAFMDRFVMVGPSAPPMHTASGKWAEAEFAHATTHWRSHFRGDAPVKAAASVTAADISSSNLVLWGDPKSNPLIAKVVSRLPIKWTEKELVVNGRTYDPATHMPTLIYPNPLAGGTRYVVINSGFTFREYDYLNNARQVPKLPDWAVYDITVPPNPRWAARVVDAGFFGETWRFKPAPSATAGVH